MYWRWLEHIHGHAGWLAAVSLLHPAIMLRKVQRAPWTVGLSTAFVTMVCAAGMLLYPEYRDRLKQSIFQTAPTIGLLFERKEHLALAAMLFAWVGALSYVAAGKTKDARLRVLSHRAFIVAAVLAIAVAALGTTVATYRTF